MSPRAQGDRFEFPFVAIKKAGYGAVWCGEKSWNGVAILGRNCEPVVTRIELPGDPADTQSRYIEAAVSGVLVATLSRQRWRTRHQSTSWSGNESRHSRCRGASGPRLHGKHDAEREMHKSYAKAAARQIIHQAAAVCFLWTCPLRGS
jgi:hypothetical protein